MPAAPSLLEMICAECAHGQKDHRQTDDPASPYVCLKIGCDCKGFKRTPLTGVDRADEKTHAQRVAESAVDHPAHYGGKDNPYEAIKVIEAWGLGFSAGNAVKYISRAGKKDPTKEIEDVEKAIWYLNRHLENLKAKR